MSAEEAYAAMRAFGNLTVALFSATVVAQLATTTGAC
jgi:hypothetical protein